MAHRLALPAVQLIVLALWIGAAVFFSAAVAPALFRVLPSRALAGVSVGAMLPVVFYTGIIAGLILLASELSRGGWHWSGGVVAAIVMILSCGIAQLVIGPRIARVRDAIAGPVDELAATDPRRIAFGRLHGMSVAWLGIAILAAVVALVLATRELHPRR